MGMYTELIFGASLKKETPKDVIKTLKTLVRGDLDTVPQEVEAFKYIFRTSSYYFGINEPLAKMWKDKIDKEWKISTRSNIKNYGSEIEQFLEWIKPWIEHCHELKIKPTLSTPMNSLNRDGEQTNTMEGKIYDILYNHSTLDDGDIGVRVSYEKDWPIKELSHLSISESRERYTAGLQKALWTCVELGVDKRVLQVLEELLNISEK